MAVPTAITVVKIELRISGSFQAAARLTLAIHNISEANYSESTYKLSSWTGQAYVLPFVPERCR